MPDHVDEAASHERWMNEAIGLARAGMRIHGGGPFGAVVVANGELVGRGCNQVTPLLDPTAHAEIVAIRDACRALQRFDLRGCQPRH
jgi:tRNA(Arg) A34 adenosine deaminase TadA